MLAATPGLALLREELRKGTMWHLASLTLGSCKIELHAGRIPTRRLSRGADGLHTADRRRGTIHDFVVLSSIDYLGHFSPITLSTDHLPPP